MKKLLLSILVCFGLIGCATEQPVYAQTNCVQQCDVYGNCQVVCAHPGYWSNGIYYLYPVGYRGYGYHGYGYRGGYHGGFHGGGHGGHR